MKLVYSLSALLFTSLTFANPTNFSPSISHANPVLRSLQKRCPPFDPAGSKNIGNGAGVQFVGGQCLSDADCQQGCCAKPCGICSGPKANFQNGKEGCGFGGSASAASPNTGVAGTNSDGKTGNADANANANTDTGDGTDSSSTSNNNANNTGTRNGNSNSNSNTTSCSSNDTNA